MSKSEFVELLKKRTKQLALDVILLYDKIQKTDSTRVIGRQLIRSVTTTAANYRAACIARSQKEFFSKMSIVVEEADETLFWLEMLKDAGFVEEVQVKPLMDEALEILKIVSKARKSASSN
ncbi:four helix bundle protein [Polaribacter glomeratus]|uniref:Four helix bundle protein n=1 Tax=Polaribacter glomeratus TaxID=102 RepID=A0A2S7WYJ8_9FLAO|nr:four helix bundle protein [Polaribacter glomeratus]PQJ82667.1 four helix bundle protein [Polaribacter glomeratus]TXD64018.1 four helix bundle protein [Polaribacter glomeratus]